MTSERSPTIDDPAAADSRRGQACLTQPGRQDRKTEPVPAHSSVDRHGRRWSSPHPLSRALRERGCRAERGRGERCPTGDACVAPTRVRSAADGRLLIAHRLGSPTAIPCRGHACVTLGSGVHDPPGPSGPGNRATFPHNPTWARQAMELPSPHSPLPHTAEEGVPSMSEAG